MRRPFARLGVAALALVCGLSARANAGDPLKPYVFLVVDTSGSMTDSDSSTGFGPPSCSGTVDNRLDHAKCAVNNIANSYGDMVLGLGRFRGTSTDTNPSNGCTMTGASCSGCSTSSGSGCTTAMSADYRLEVLAGLVDGGNSTVARWTDFTADTCSADNTMNPDLYANGATPVAGALKGVKRYFQGLQGSDGTTLWPSAAPGFDPIANDPLRTTLLPSGAQCRPYITIMLTDGDETCTTFANTQAAATSLLTTQKTVTDPVTGMSRTIDYRIETKVIGFGQSPGDTQIEGLARAGGTAGDGPGGANEGYYAQNEETLQLAISQIIADALRFEQCNNLDDDCDVLVDEDFPNKGQACDNGLFGVCRGTGTFVCTANGAGTQCNITNPGQAPGTETCNNLDDDCDSFVDEGSVCTGCGTVELCNNLDDDCDNRIDENLVTDCGTDVGECTRGTQTCMNGTWVGCNATGPFTEVCDGLDNDCDGVVDGLSEQCSTLPGGNPDTGPCHPGTRVCPPNGNGTWGPCLGEVGPITEVCDTIDNDCDTRFDEATGGADCSSSCGTGTTVCMNGTLVCEGQTSGGAEVCNDFDDDCDGNVDEGVADMGPCSMAPDGAPLCMPGVLRCVGGQFVCQGGEPAQPEACDCLDNDCDSRTDEEPPALCPSGQACVDCECAPPCAGGEFPCPVGRICENNFCVRDPCYDKVCDPLPNGDKQVCDPDSGDCVRACDAVQCPATFVCVGPLGECRPDNCITFPDRCTAEQQCVAGTCVSDPCFGVTCGAGEYCTGGTCVRSCTGVVCGSGQMCQLGECVPDRCNGRCGTGQVCDQDNGGCVIDPCLDHSACPQGEACNPQTGDCERDACLGVTCPGPGEICKLGTCAVPQAPAKDLITTGGGGCLSAGGGGSGAGAGALALLVLLALGSRKQKGGRS
ncbi:MAG TPA: MopE-related protein [Kofleriaceae bacterium]|nr:MopE-related protein [Kofleriaceae bacterium]